MRTTRQTRSRERSGLDKQELDPRIAVVLNDEKENQYPQTQPMQQISSKLLPSLRSSCTGLNVIDEAREDDFSAMNVEQSLLLTATNKRSRAELKERPSFCSHHSMSVRERKMKFLQASGVIDRQEDASKKQSNTSESVAPSENEGNNDNIAASSQVGIDSTVESPPHIRDDIAFTKFVTLTPGTTINLARQFHALNEKVNQISEEVMSPYVLTSGISRRTLSEADENGWPRIDRLLCSGLESAPMIEQPSKRMSVIPMTELVTEAENEDSIPEASRFSEITIRSHRCRSILRQSSTNSLVTISDEQDHPFLGRKVHENLNRAIYLASARTFLSHVPLWLEQRPFDMRRVREIVRAKKDNPIFPGAISVFTFPEGITPSLTNPQTMAIFDGQHRCHALNILLQDSPTCDITILIEVYLVTSRQQIIDLYVEINKAQPVQEIDVPDAIASVTKRVIDEACSTLMSKYPKCFSSRVNCRPPNMHWTSLRNSIFRAEIVETQAIRNSDELVNLLEAANAKLIARPDSDWGKIRPSALAKAKEFGFFLGLTTSWLDAL